MATTEELERLEALDEAEDGRIARFRDHPVLAGITRLPRDDLHALLLQRRFVSHQFTPAYDLVIDLLGDETARRIARAILREEYPDGSGHTPSHREDMRTDLQLGIPAATIAAARETAATRRTIADTFELLRTAGAQPDADLRLLAILRFWGEVLVSVEYTRLWERIGPELEVGGENRSVFYHPHLVHDAKARPLSTVSLLASTHSDRLAMRLSELLARVPSPDFFGEVEDEVLRLKSRFYDQFLPALPEAPPPEA